MGKKVNGERLRSLREAAGLTQAELSKRAFVVKRTVERAEQSQSVNEGTIHRLAEALGVAAAELILADDGAEPQSETIRPASSAAAVRAGPSRPPQGTRPAGPAAWLARDDDLRPYGTALREQFGKIQFLGLPHLRDVEAIDVDRLFVPLLLCSRQIAPDLPIKAWPERATLDAVLEKERSLVVLGDPGSGKSTLVGWLTWQLAEETANLWQQQLEERIAVPILVRELAIRPDMTWDDLLEAWNDTPLGRALSRKTVLAVFEQIEKGKALILLDGLDEISNLELRHGLHRAVWEGLRRHPECRWLATSRVVGYDTVPMDRTPEETDGDPGSSNRLDYLADDRTEETHEELQPQVHGRASPAPGFALRYVVPFDDEQLATFANHWYGQREESQELATKCADDLVRAVQREKAITALARVPNLLTLMALVHRVDADLPDGKARLYGKIVEAYLESIDNYRKLRERPDTLSDKQRWLARVAYALQCRRGNEGGKKRSDSEILIGRTELHQLLAEAMRESGRYRGDEDVKKFLDSIQRRSGLLVERGEGQFAFVHLSFLEFFAARHVLDLLTDALDDPENLEAGRLAARTNDDAWRETFVFFFELLADASPGLRVKLRRRLLGNEWEGGTPFSQEERSRTLLLARLAGDAYAGLLEHRDAAIRACCRWEVEAQQRHQHFIWDHDPLAFGLLLLSMGEQATAILSTFAEEAAAHSLTTLTLCGTPAADLAPLATLTNLRWLFLSGTPAADLAPLATLTNLRTLDLNGTPAADLAPLATLTNLQTLFLSGTPAADLAPLATLTGLRVLYLTGTHGAPQQVEQLRKALPQCVIKYESGSVSVKPHIVRG